MSWPPFVLFWCVTFKVPNLPENRRRSTSAWMPVTMLQQLLFKRMYFLRVCHSDGLIRDRRSVLRVRGVSSFGAFDYITWSSSAVSICEIVIVDKGFFKTPEELNGLLGSDCFTSHTPFTLDRKKNNPRTLLNIWLLSFNVNVCSQDSLLS